MKPFTDKSQTDGGHPWVVINISELKCSVWPSGIIKTHIQCADNSISTTTHATLLRSYALLVENDGKWYAFKWILYGRLILRQIAIDLKDLNANGDTGHGWFSVFL